VKTPLVSVIIPTYNRSQKVQAAVASVLEQTYRKLEVIVVDDGSTDDTVASLAKFGDRIRIVNQDNRGPSAARNRGVAVSNGEIVSFLDSDDVWLPHKLQSQVDLMVQLGEKVTCCVTNITIIGTCGKKKTSFAAARVESQCPQGYWKNPSQIIATRFLQFNTVVAMWKSAFEKCGGFNEEMRILEDHDLAFRLSLLGPWAFISEPLVIKRDDIGGLSSQAQSCRLKHNIFWLDSLKRLLSENQIDCATTKKWLKVGIREAEERVKLFQTAESSGLLRARFLNSWLTYRRYWAAVRRRGPIWPRVQVTPVGNFN
jgi:glycosyltransferase involved in cell wall biosynthesis